jgi:hypothetical protein
MEWEWWISKTSILPEADALFLTVIDNMGMNFGAGLSRR